jgi:hypothetical protein
MRVRERKREREILREREGERERELFLGYFIALVIFNDHPRYKK